MQSSVTFNEESATPPYTERLSLHHAIHGWYNEYAAESINAANINQLGSIPRPIPFAEPELTREYFETHKEEEILYTPLHVAVRRRNVDMVKILLELGADPSLPSTNGETAFSKAIDLGHSEIINLLKENRSVLDAKNSASRGSARASILHNADYSGQSMLFTSQPAISCHSALQDQKIPSSIQDGVCKALSVTTNESLQLAWDSVSNANKLPENLHPLLHKVWNEPSRTNLLELDEKQHTELMHAILEINDPSNIPQSLSLAMFYEAPDAEVTTSDELPIPSGFQPIAQNDNGSFLGSNPGANPRSFFGRLSTPNNCGTENPLSSLLTSRL